MMLTYHLSQRNALRSHLPLTCPLEVIHGISLRVIIRIFLKLILMVIRSLGLKRILSCYLVFIVLAGISSGAETLLHLWMEVVASRFISNRVINLASVLTTLLSSMLPIQ